MIGRVAVHLSEEDASYLSYVRAITSALRVVPDFVYLEEEGLLSILSRPSEERQSAIRKHIEEFFEDFNLYTFSEKDEKTLEELQNSYDLLFVKYKRQFFGKSMPEWVLSGTDRLRLWVYKEGSKSNIERVCLSVDFSERSVGQVEFADYLKGIFGFEYELIYAMNMSRFVNKLSRKDYYKSLLNKREEAKHMYTDTFGRRELSLVFLEGDPYRDMVRYINSAGYHLVVIGRRGRGERKRIGSVSLHMARSLKCPLIVL
ncbi:MAG: universal stress protein [Aquificaceae bacterium]